MLLTLKFGAGGKDLKGVGGGLKRMLPSFQERERSEVLRKRIM